MGISPPPPEPGTSQRPAAPLAGAAGQRRHAAVGGAYDPGASRGRVACVSHREWMGAGDDQWLLYGSFPHFRCLAPVGFGECPDSWGFCFHDRHKYLLESNPQELGKVDLGHLPTHVFWGILNFDLNCGRQLLSPGVSIFDGFLLPSNGSS